MKKKIIGAAVLTLLALLLAASALAACPTEDAHRYGPWKTKTSATCTRQGHQFRYCQKCDHWEQRYTAKLPHTPGEMTVTKAPTCAQTGRQEAVCQVCGHVIQYTIDKLPHTYGNLMVVRTPTCTQDGRGEYTCTDCGHVKRKTLPKLGHDWGETVVTKAPTCKAAGKGTQTCTRCGTTRMVKVDRLEHVYGEWTVKREPEGKKKGLREGVCTLCGAVRSEHFYAEGTLYEDMEPCGEVIALQERLKDLGYYKGSIRTGAFGKVTTSAVANFQRRNGLEETGLADTATRQAIDEQWEKATGKKIALPADVMENAEQAQAIAE